MTHAMLGNAAVAALLALLALAVGCVYRSPTVRHLAWLLVLLKLVTPPLFNVPLPVLPASWGAPTSDSAPPTRVIQLAHSGPDIAGYLAENTARSSAWWHPYWPADVGDWALVVWVAGAAAWSVWQGRRIVRFRRRVARAEDGGPEVAEAARRLAEALGIPRPPAVKTTTGIGSPMLWGWGRGAIILFPRELLARLAPEARDTLLAHELAHFLRRDHWVRLLEFVATGLYWWHPAVWLARAGIEAAEEECCDAWVVGALAASPRRYAEALLATVDYVAEVRRPYLPPGASAANRGARLLHQRLVGIIHAKAPSRSRAAVALRAAILAALLFQPVLQAAAPESGIRDQESGVSQTVAHDSFPRTPGPRPRSSPKPAEPRSWAAATAPGGALTVKARDHEVVLRRPDGTETVLGPGRPLALAFAPDGKRLATAGPGNLVRTWDDRGAMLAETRVAAPARSVAYVPDGSHLLVLDAAGGISVRDPHTLAPVTGWSVEGPANSIACAPNGQTVAVAFGSWLDESGWVECWSIAEHQKLVTYETSAPVGATRFGPDGRMLVIGGWSGLLTWRRLPSGESLAQRQLSKDLVACAAFSPDAGTLPLEPPPEPVPPETLTLPDDLFQGVGRLPKR